MNYKCICNYCGHVFHFVVNFYTKDIVIKCEACGDKDIKKVETGDRFGYNEDTRAPDAYIPRRKK